MRSAWGNYLLVGRLRAVVDLLPLMTFVTPVAAGLPFWALRHRRTYEVNVAGILMPWSPPSARALPSRG